MNEEIIKDLYNYNFDHIVIDTNYSIEMSNRFDDYSLLQFTYGTTPFDTFNKIIESLDKKPKRFVVFGSSIGWQCFFWNHLFPDIPAVGYELHDIRVNYANVIIEKYNLSNIEFLNYDILDADLQDGDLIWENNLCMDDDVCDEMNLYALSRYKDISIISYRAILPLFSESKLFSESYKILIPSINNNFNSFNIKLKILPTSWVSDQDFHILE